MKKRLNSRSRVVARCAAWALAAASLALVPGSAEVAAIGPEYVALAAPSRLVDTRPGAVTVDGIDAGAGIRQPGTETHVQVAGRAGVPADAAAVTLNVTAVAPTGIGYLTVYPTGSERPLAASLTFDAGHNTANLVIAEVGTGGRVSIYVSTATHVVVDVSGHFPDGGFVSPEGAERLADTRPGGTTIDGRFAGSGVVGAGGTLTLPVAGRGATPSDAGTVVLTVTAVQPVDIGYLTVHPKGTDRPLAASLTFGPGRNTAITVITGLGTDGAVDIYTSTATHLVVDVFGLLPDEVFVALPTPRRLTDTRLTETTIDGEQAGIGLRPMRSTLQLDVAGRAGVPADASSVVLTVSAVRAFDIGYVTAHPTGSDRPLAASLTYDTTRNTTNTVVARLGAGGDICLHTYAATHLVVDIVGHLPGPPPPAAGPTCPPITYGSPQLVGTGGIMVDINNAGIVVGVEYHGSAAESDALWWPSPAGGPQLIPGVPGDARSSRAVAINDRNQVLVDVYSEVTGPHLLVIDLPSGRSTGFPGIEDVPGLEELDVLEVAAVGLNDRSEVLLDILVGDHGADGAVAIWNSATGAVETHPDLVVDSFASAINDLGHVVGASTGDAFYWDRDSDVVHRLDRTGYSLADASGLNDRGQVVGMLSDENSDTPAVFWSDRSAAPIRIPGPSPWVAGINEAGLVHGRTQPAGLTWMSPGIWDSVSGQWLEFPVQEGSSINALNDVGQVVGGIGEGRNAIWHPV